jgi:hypothetical protein
MQISDWMRTMHGVQVNGKPSEIKQAQIVNDSIKQTISENEEAVEKVLHDAGIKDVPEMKEAVRRLITERIPITKETLQSVQQILQKGEGTVLQKLDVLSVMAQKKISVTPKSYEAVFRAIHGPSLDKILNQLAQESTELIPQIRNEARPNVQALSTGKISKQLEVLNEAIKSEQPLNIEKLQKLVEQIRRNPEMKQLSPDTQKKVQQVMQQIEKVIQETPRNQSVVSVEKIAQTIEKTVVSQVARQVALEMKKMEPGYQPSVESIGQEKNVVRQGEVTTSEPLRKLAELVMDIRISGKVNRSQMTAIQEMVVKITEEAKITPQLMQDIQELTKRVMKELRMSVSYEAVGREADAKAIIQRSMDTLIKMFKLPIAEVVASRNQIAHGQLSLSGEQTDEIEPQFLRPVSETLFRLGGITALARQELLASLGDESNLQMDSLFNVARTPERIVQDFVSVLRNTAGREGLPREEVRQMEQIIQQLEEKVSSPMKDVNKILESFNALEQLFMSSGERMAALTTVQATNFERVTQYIPDHLHQVANQFKQMKQEILNNVGRMSQFLQQNVPQAASYVQRIIEPTIEMVNRLVNKGEFALFADMEFEHDVLRISSDLQQVKGLLDRGKQEEAIQLFRGVRADLEKLNWQPSYMKVERVFSKLTGDAEVQNPFQMYGQQWREESFTGRSVQEIMRGMGLNHEREAVEWMSRRESGIHFPGSHSSSGNQENPPHNFKSMLMNGIEGNISPRAKEIMEHALSNITGQQLLSKQDTGATVQSMHVQIPLPWEEVQSVQMQVRARTNGEQMDWENCNLFFFLDTPKFGETGVSVTVVNREMVIRVQNDHPLAEQAFTPYISKMKEEIQRMGYHVNGVAFGPITPQKQADVAERMPTVDIATARKQTSMYSSQEGVDFSV